MSSQSHEALKSLVRKVTSASGFTHHAGVEIDAVNPGSAVMTLRRKPELLQFNGFFHGGVIAGLADHAAGAAVTTGLADGLIGITIDMHVTYLAAARGSLIRARAACIQFGKTICVARVEVFSESTEGEDRCAIATVVLRVVPMPTIEGEPDQGSPDE